MTFEDELRRVVDQLADHLRQEAAGRLHAAMPELHDASRLERQAAVNAAREEAERDFNERIEAVKREASEQAANAEREAADRVAASERQAVEQLEAARREHAERIEVLQRETAEQLSARERETAEQLNAKDREAEERLNEKAREAAEQVDAKSREAAERLEAREREIAELLEAKNRETAERLEALERQALERAEEASRQAGERLGLLESTMAQRVAEGVATATAEAEARAREAGRAEGRKEGLSALADGLNELAKAQSLSEVLDALSRAVEREVPDVAVVLANGNHVRTWRLTGFGHSPEHGDALTVALQDAGLIRGAIQTGQIVRGHSSSADVPSFAAFSYEQPRALAAFPLVVGGTTVAVVYGEGPDDDGATWQASLEALAACASRLLETITAFRTAALLAKG